MRKLLLWLVMVAAMVAAIGPASAQDGGDVVFISAPINNLYQAALDASVATPDPLPEETTDRTQLLYLGLGAAGVALVVLVVIAWARQRP